MTPNYSLKLNYPRSKKFVGFCLQSISLVALFITMLASTQSVYAQLPVDPHIMHGNADIDAGSNHMSITNSPNTIIDWQGFSIGHEQSVHFQQQNADSQVLNRIVGNDPSEIFGGLSSNGGVWLINPHGVLFGEGARIDVGGLVASTLDISNLDFLAKNYHFNAIENGSGNVLNQGEIRTSLGGRVWMTGEQVQNEGLIQSPQGHVVLAAGNSVEFIDSGAPNVVVRVSAPENEAVNLGTMVATNGQVDVHGSIVNQQGIIRADSLSTDTSGRIVLQANDSLTLAENSLTQADKVNLRANSEVLLKGRVDASNSQGSGGKVEVTGDSVVLLNADIDASGGTQGGTVHLGGGWQGGGDLPHAREVTVGVGSEIKANGAENGGEIVVWSTQSSEHYGSLEAKGGGRVELSSKGKIRQDGEIQAGFDGTVLFDPKDLVITTDINTSSDDVNNAQFDINSADISFIDSTVIEDLLSFGNNVTLQANNDILILSSIIPFSDDGTVGDFTLQAGHSIFLLGGVLPAPPAIPTNIPVTPPPVTINTSGGDFTAIAGDPGADGTLRDNSHLTLAAIFNIDRVEEATSIVYIGQESRIDVGPGIATLAAVDGNLINLNSDEAILTSGTGHWLIYAADPSTTNEGFTSFNKHYNQPYIAENAPPDYASSGNWFFYSIAPVLNVTPNSDTITYGQAIPSFFPEISGYIDGDNESTAEITGNTSWSISGDFSSSGNATTGQHDVSYASGLNSDLGYQFSDNTSSTNELTVNQAPLIASNILIQDKTYDATTNAQFSPDSGSSSGKISNDDVFLDANAAFDDPNVGANKIVNITDVSISGSDASNYFLSSDSTPTIAQASITEAPLFAVNFGIEDKVYDTTTGAQLKPDSGNLSGVFGNDDVSVLTANAIAAFEDANAGENKLVEIEGISIGGSGASNYFLDNETSITANATIDKAPLNYVADSATRDVGQSLSDLTGHFRESDFVGGENEQVINTDALDWIARTPSANPPPGIYAIDGVGATAVNYELIQATSNASALTIDPPGSPPKIPPGPDGSTPINDPDGKVPKDGIKQLSRGRVDQVPQPIVISELITWRFYKKLSNRYLESGYPELAILFSKLAVESIRKLKSIDDFAEKLKMHEQLVMLLLDQERYIEARFDALRMLKEFEYRYYSVNKNSLKQVMEYNSAESKHLEKVAGIVNGFIKDNRDEWLLNDEIHQEQTLSYQAPAYGPSDYVKLASNHVTEIMDDSNNEIIRGVIPDHSDLGGKSGQIIVPQEHSIEEIRARIKEIGHIEDIEAELKASKHYLNEIEHRDRVQTDLKELAEDLDEKTLLLFYLLFDEKLTILLYSPNKFVPDSLIEIPISRVEMNSHILTAREMLKNPGDYNQALLGTKVLYNYLIAPIKAELEQYKPKNETLTLAIYQTGALRYVPFSALQDGDKYLIQDYALTSYLEGAISYAKGRPLTKHWQITGLGVSESLDKDFSDLGGVPGELDRIKSRHKYLNKDFTKGQLDIAVADKDIQVLHIATHFKLGSTTDVSFLLAGDGSHINITDFEALQMKGKELVTLSACETGLGTLAIADNNGKEVEGLAITVFKKTNADSVLATLWSIADESTATFMEQFYRLRGQHNLSKAEAIQQTQLCFINAGNISDGICGEEQGDEYNRIYKKYADPFYWAPFTLMGNWL